jgi:hypothetical protein
MGEATGVRTGACEVVPTLKGARSAGTAMVSAWLMGTMVVWEKLLITMPYIMATKAMLAKMRARVRRRPTPVRGERSPRPTVGTTMKANHQPSCAPSNTVLRNCDVSGPKTFSASAMRGPKTKTQHRMR